MTADTVYKIDSTHMTPDSDRIWTQIACLYALLPYNKNYDAGVLNAAIWLSGFYRTLQGEIKFALCGITNVRP